VHGLHTPFGPIGYSITRAGNRVTFEFAQLPALPPGGIAIASPLERAPREAEADGRILRSLTTVSSGCVHGRDDSCCTTEYDHCKREVQRPHPREWRIRRADGASRRRLLHAR
jgi:hypothetical protein